MSKAAAYRLRDLVQQLDRALLTLELTDFDDKTDEATLSLRDCGRIERTLEDAAAFLHGLRFANGDDAMAVSPTCVVEFVDGEITRMTTWSASGKPDAHRGIKLAHHAYRSRTGREPPAIKAMYFERDGLQLLPLTPEEIAEAMR